MVGPIGTLETLVRQGGTIRAECRQCGRVALFAPADLYTYWRKRKWDCAWPSFARHLSCKSEGGCGAKWPLVSWSPGNPPAPDDDPPPPKPRFARAGKASPPKPIDFESYRKRRAG